MKKYFTLGVICILFSISAIGQSAKEWEKVQSINTWNVYEQFINTYPNGKYTEMAKQKLGQLKVPNNKVKTNPTIVTATVDPLLSKNTSPIVIKRKAAYVNDKRLSWEELQQLLFSNPESEKVYKRALSNGRIAQVPTYIGCAFVIYGSIMSVSNPSKSIAPLVGGCGLMVLSLPFIITSNVQMKHSIKLYNSNLKTGFNSNQKLDFGITQNGVGLRYSF